MKLLLTKPTSPSDAFRIAADRGLLPTSLGTEEIRGQFAVELRSKSVFSARATSAIFLAKVQEVIRSITGDERGEGDERASGMTVAEGRAVLLETLRALGYTPEEGFPGDVGDVPPAVAGTLQDLSSRRRLDLIIRTQTELMQGAGFQMRAREAIEFFPAFELVRFESREMPRDWKKRFEEAGGTVLIDEDGRERLIAHQNDPVWSALGDSALFEDALDVDHSPFAFGSGMGQKLVSASVWNSLKGAVDFEEQRRDEAKEDLLPGNVATAPSESAARRILRNFEEATQSGRRVSAKTLRDQKRAELLKRFALEGGAQ